MVAGRLRRSRCRDEGFMLVEAMRSSCVEKRSSASEKELAQEFEDEECWKIKTHELVTSHGVLQEP